MRPTRRNDGGWSRRSTTAIFSASTAPTGAAAQLPVPPWPGLPAPKPMFEIFVNSRNMDHYAWTVGLTRMISAVFRRGGDVSFVADEL